MHVPRCRGGLAQEGGGGQGRPAMYKHTKNQQSRSMLTSSSSVLVRSGRISMIWPLGGRCTLAAVRLRCASRPL